MNSMNTDWLPTPSQELLLKAVLADGDESYKLWQSWKSQVDLNNADAGSQRLLPHLYRKLFAKGHSDPDLEKYKGVYRLFWYKNQMLFNVGAEILKQLHARHLKTMLLKGAPLSLLYYKDVGLRPMNDIDILVETNRAQEAVECIQQSGFVPDPAIRVNFTHSIIPIIHGFGFVNSQNHGVDLHWHILPEMCRPDSDVECWRNAEALELNGVKTLTLSPTDLLFNTLAGGARWEQVATIRWVVDAVTILRTATIDWERILAHARKHKLTLPLLETLGYLRGRFSVTIPDSVLERLRNIPVLHAERREYEYKTANYERRTLGHFPMHWYDYLRLKDFRMTAETPFGFIRYLQRFWGLKSLWEVPVQMLRFAFERAGKSNGAVQITYTLREMKKETVK